MKPTPLLFVGHGSPMNALGANPYRAAWAALGERLERPLAILCVSAHWETRGTLVSSVAQPETIHDFYGFPDELYRIRYPASGSPELAYRVAELLGDACGADAERGLDHGAWCPLLGLSPGAEIPIVQLSLARALDPSGHLALASRLAPLRDEGILVIGSGDAVHNLRIMREGPPYAWAPRIDKAIGSLIRSIAAGGAAERGDALARLADYPSLDRDARLAVPTEEHFLPLLYVAALIRPGERFEVFSEAIEYGSVSMTGYALGLPGA